ncbi:putative cyclopentanol dehydrogenase [Caenibius tardaugens NBRC 16725]|uniref:Putative cyclopentanol dehydrogenase n=1 Tax=Caenibius tardaugens NBRC 16725 TaxID=1219035 RepID=U3A0B1_9SPHN|nr:glucose 1-dehydrogenase [Caenibius tardaugens]AZI35280.1 glucose 1-dehydrogenase [Caenibius tardaugens NBRC 16725]GAD51084.1 putative cyclopentanol dehydrogenase [Caenibius tardaugens NBRC 16725]
MNREANGRVAGKVALVTGASSGLGEAIARLLAEEGARVMVCDIDVEGGRRVAAAIEAAGGRALFHAIDVSSECAWDDAMAAVAEQFGGLDICVNNAGIGPYGDMDMDFALWRKVMAINLDGVFLGTRAAIRLMATGGRKGSVVNISSTMAYVADYATAAYSASKGGVRSLTKAAALHCAAKKLPIRVNSVHPGMCLTPMVETALERDPAFRDEQIARHPIGHLGDPRDIAYGVLYLASDEANFSTGTELVIDGGYLAK